MLTHLCPKCRSIIPLGKAYCDRCQVQVDKSREEAITKARKKYNQAYDKQRDPKYAQFYHSVQWRQLSSAMLSKAGYKCQRCERKGIIRVASDVHHEVPIQTDEGWIRRFDPSNLIVLCAECHNTAHHRFQKGPRGGKKVPENTGTP